MLRALNRTSQVQVFALALLVVYLVIGVGFMLLIPPWETPDAPSHFLYIRHLMLTGKFPLPDDYDTGYVYPATLYEWHHPPLYYVIQSWWLHVLDRYAEIVGEPEFELNPAFSFSVPTPRYRVPLWPWWLTHPSYLTVLTLRLLNLVLFGLPMLFAVYVALLEILREPAISTLAAAVVLLQPQVLFMCVSVQNDIVAVVCATTIWSIITVTSTSAKPLTWRHVVIIGTLAGLGGLSKVSFVPIFALAGVWALVEGRHLGVGKSLLLFALPNSLLLILYSQFGGDHIQALLTYILTTRAQTQLSLGTSISMLVSSFWGRFGWMNVPISRMLTVIFAFASSIGMLVSAGYFLFYRRPFAHLAVRRLLPWLIGGVGLQIAFVFAVFVPLGQPQGRFIFPVLLPFWLLVLSGCAFKPELRPACNLKWVGALAALTLVFDVVAVYRLLEVYWTI